MEKIELEIEKLVYEGLGLSHHNGKVVFVKNAIKGEVVEAEIVSKNQNFLRANTVNIIKKSNKRIAPKCPYTNVCGACDLAYIEYDYLCELKNEILKEIFQNFENLEFKPFVKSPDNYCYRHKTQYPVSETKKSKRVLAGYFREKTHELVNIKYCPIQPNIVDEIVEFIRENWNLSCYIERTHKGLLRHINIRISTKGDILLTLVLNSEIQNFKKEDVENFANLIMNNFNQIKGVLVNFNSTKTNKITGKDTILIKGQDFVEEYLEDKIYKIGSGSFFQVNPKCASLLFNCAKNLITKKGTLLDLYGGVGTIGIFMKDVASKITLVEENKEAIKLAHKNYKLNNILKYEIFENRAEDKMQDFIKEKRTFENIIIDPPRKGSDKNTLLNISKMTNSIIYISCNPMTLKRDAKTLKELGFNFKSVQGVDMFPYTHHIECVAHFIKEGN